MAHANLSPNWEASAKTLQSPAEARAPTWSWEPQRFIEWHTGHGKANNSKNHSIANAENIRISRSQVLSLLKEKQWKADIFKKGRVTLVVLFLEVSLPLGVWLFQVSTVNARREGILFAWVFLYWRTGKTTMYWNKRMDYKSLTWTKGAVCSFYHTKVHSNSFPLKPHWTLRTANMWYLGHV